MENAHAKTIHIFYMFAAEDEAYAKKLQSHLASPQKLYQFTDWYHTSILGGENIEQRINENLDKADIILLFTSADFVHSEITTAQVQRALERSQKQSIAIIPIKLRPVPLIGEPYYKLHMLPKNGEAITTWKNEEEAFQQVAEEIEKVIKAKIGERDYTLGPLTAEQAASVHHILETTEIKSARYDEHSTVVYLQTYVEKTYPETCEHLLDWRKYMVPNGPVGGNQLKDPSQWNTARSNDLYRLRKKLDKGGYTTIRLRGKHLLSCAFAFGHVFSKNAGFVIEQDQGPELWRSDTAENPAFRLQIRSQGGKTEGELLDGEGTTIALGISVNRSLEAEVRAYVAARQEKIAALLLVEVPREEGKVVQQNAGDAVALANRVVEIASTFKQQWNARKLLLFYAGPVTGATFIGQKLNAVCPRIQIMEYDRPEGVYNPTFLLS